MESTLEVLCAIQVKITVSMFHPHFPNINHLTSPLSSVLIEILILQGQIKNHY